MANDLPKGWISCKLGDIIELSYGKSLPAKKRDASGKTPVYGSNGIVGTHSSILVNNSCIIVGRKGTAGSVVFSNSPCWPIDTTYFIERSALLNIKYTFYLLKSLRLETLDRSTAIPGLNRDDAYSLSIKLAPLNEQRRIVEKIEKLFSELDKGEEALRDVQKLLARYRQSVLKAAVTGELTADWRAQNADKLESGQDLLTRILQTRRDTWEGRGKYKEPVAPDTTDLPKLPEGWTWASLGQLISKIEAGKNYRCDERPPLENETGIVKISAVTWNEFDEEESKTIISKDHLNKKLLIQSGDLLISRANTLELVGASVVVKAISRKLQLSDKVLRLKCLEPIEKWINYVLKSYLGRRQIEALATGAQQSMRNISQKNIEKIAIPLPPIDEIKALIESIQASHIQQERMSFHCETELARSKALRQSILKDAFSGRLVPQDESDEPAAKLLARIKQTRASAPKKTERKASA